MNSIKTELYYTSDHDWIEFQGSVAYVGVCSFKLTGFRQIQEIVFSDLSSDLKKGDTIASIRYNDYRIEAKMPVDGKVIEINDKFSEGSFGTLREDAEGDGWLCLIALNSPEDRHGLIPPDQYKFRTNREN